MTEHERTGETVTRTPPFHADDYTEVQPSDRPGWYLVIAYGPQLGRMTLLETRDLVAANRYAINLAGLMEGWHRTSPV